MLARLGLRRGRPLEAPRLACGVMARNNPDVPPEMLEQAAQAMAAKRTAVVVKATHTVSWDHRKLGH